uniref:Uncharacterized protein n=1 Tax=Trichuris muris TaxID=70415 RepID=A0A5S6QDW3_TRIMR
MPAAMSRQLPALGQPTGPGALSVAGRLSRKRRRCAGVLPPPLPVGRHSCRRRLPVKRTYLSGGVLRSKSATALLRNFNSDEVGRPNAGKEAADGDPPTLGLGGSTSVPFHYQSLLGAPTVVLRRSGRTTTRSYLTPSAVRGGGGGGEKSMGSPRPQRRERCSMNQRLRAVLNGPVS